MRLAAVNPRIDFNFDSVFATEVSVQTSLSLSTFLVFDFLVKKIYICGLAMSAHFI